MKRSHLKALWKQGFAAALAAVLLLAAGCGAAPGETEKTGTAAPDTSDAAAAIQTMQNTQEPEAPVGTEGVTAPETVETEASAPETGEPASTREVLGVISTENERFNRFLTGFVQQEIVNTKTELDEDAELVRFAFRYLQYNDPDAVAEQEDGSEPCRVLTLEQVNETLTSLLGRTVSPDREDYSILEDGAGEFHCSFRDGSFVHTPPYHKDAFGFPLRFALIEGVDEENSILYFRLYKVNPNIWEPGEADRHVPILPAMSFLDAEGAPEITRLGTGTAVLRDLGEDLQLIEYEITQYR